MSVKRIDIEKYCALCAREFAAEDDSVICPDDGGFLMPLKHDPFVGQLVESKFEVIELVGCGGWGSVYKARDIKLGRMVAFKVMRADLASTAEKLQRFEREARVMSSLNHPHICSVYDYGILEGGQPYLVLEYLSGQTLQELIAEEKLAVPRLIPLMRQTAQAVAAAHALGIIHRDLKPANIMVIKDPTSEVESIKIIDFGLAKTYETLMPEQLTRTGMTIGTPSFMSPEQVQGIQLDGRSDVYSFGCVLWQVLTGELAVTGRNVFEVMQHHLTAERSREDFDAGIPDGLKDITLTCLKQDVGQRYQSMKEVADDLISLETTGKIKKRHRLSTKRRQQLTIASIVIGASALVAVASFGFVKMTENDASKSAARAKQRFSQQLQEMRDLTARGDSEKAKAAGDKLKVELKASGKEFSPEMEQVDGLIIEALEKVQSIDKVQRRLDAVPYAQHRFAVKKKLLADQNKLDSEEYYGLLKQTAGSVQALDSREARPYLQEVLSWAKKRYGADSKQVVEPLNGLAWFEYSEGNFKEGVKLYDELLPLVNRYYKPQDDTYIELRGQLAWILCNTGDFERARKMAEEGLPLMNESTPPRFRLDFLGAGALAEMHCGQYDKAIDLYKKQIELSKQIDPRQGLQYKGSLAKCLFAAKRYKEAEPILVEVLKNLDPTSYTGRSTYKVMFADYLELLRSTGRAAEAQQVEAAGKV